MKKIRYLLTAITLALLSFTMTTQAADQTKIDQVVKKVNDIKFIEGQFAQQKKLQGVAYPLKAQGHFMFWKGQGFYLATEKPFFNAMTITGTSMINWQADGTGTLAQEQIGIIQREVNKTLLAFFSADIELIQQRFSANWVFDKDNWQLTLIPKLDVIQKNMRSAVIHGNNYVQGLTVTAGNGDETTIEFSGQQERAEPSNAQCRWFYLQAQDACSKFH
jgi:outer membrane lipoprotein-sorting protein